MDRATKIYAGVLVAAALAFTAWTLYEDPQVKALNAALDSDPAVGSYRYRFHVLRVEGATAVMATPRSPQVPVSRVLPALYPEVAGLGPESEAFQRARKALAGVQARAREIVLARPEIEAVRWEIDRGWLHRRGILPGET